MGVVGGRTILPPIPLKEFYDKIEPKNDIMD
ncbi:hypothetical protein HPSA_03995 [Helicobacter pylori SouthAfrica7]|uniref:Uncharacterized protein n=1 Tax=Helicobacter pylori (strain SouthAfrica7) TaxID=907239 RepID=E8QS27_HELPW|nr:hypothetical protein HPSA_03995 [Helicobacter pylori SouthAfrica7]